MSNYRKLDVWQRGMDLAVAVYHVTRRFPADESFGLTSQMRRAAMSIPANLAEGCGRQSTQELIRFVGIACGSQAELETLLELANKVELLPTSAEHDLVARVQELGRMLTALRQSLERKKESN